jgi:hypothetical protein
MKEKDEMNNVGDLNDSVSCQESEFTDYVMYGFGRNNHVSSLYGKYNERVVFCYDHVITTTSCHRFRVMALSINSLSTIYELDLEMSMPKQELRRRSRGIETTDIDLLKLNSTKDYFIFGSTHERCIQIHKSMDGKWIARIVDSSGGIVSADWLNCSQNLRLITFSEHMVIVHIIFLMNVNSLIFAS